MHAGLWALANEPVAKSTERALLIVVWGKGGGLKGGLEGGDVYDWEWWGLGIGTSDRKLYIGSGTKDVDDWKK